MALLFTASDGTTYRVVDICFGVPPASPGKAVRLPIGDPRATSRCFLPVGGERSGLIRTVDLGQQRDTDPATLEAQLRRCAWWDPRPPDVIRGTHGEAAGHMGA